MGNLLGKNSSAKIKKGKKLDYDTYILYLAPHKQNSKGVNICPFASKGCTKACLYTSGMGKFTNVQQARVNKTDYYVERRHEFLKQLFKEVGNKLKTHKRNGKKFAVRLNGTSDINWMRQKIDGKNIFQTYPDVQFYDYTKNHFAMFENSYPNYHLTFSRSEDNEQMCLDLLSDGFNVSMVFDKELPSEYKGYRVIDGDETDLRFLDDKNVIVGLKYKRTTAKETNDFVIKL
jgi:hypothetical protein